MRKLLDLADLMRAQAFDIHQSTEIIIVGKDENLIFTAFQVVIPSFQGFNNSQKFLILSFISSLNGDYLLKEKNYEILLANFRLRKIWIIVSHVTRRMLVQSHLT